MMEGLEVFQLASAMRVFPDVFEPLFVSVGSCAPQDVIDVLQPKLPMTDAQDVVYSFLIQFVMDSNGTGKCFIRAKIKVGKCITGEMDPAYAAFPLCDCTCIIMY